LIDRITTIHLPYKMEAYTLVDKEAENT